MRGISVRVLQSLALWLLCAVLLAACAAHGASARGMQVAVTVDDLPGYTRAEGMTRVQIVDAIVEALRDNQVPGAYGFVTQSAYEGTAEDHEVIQEWVEAGYLIGNHTAGHRHLNEQTVDQFVADIDTQDRALSAFPQTTRRIFRFPFLDEGEDMPKRDAVRAYLRREGYRIAQVTLHWDDWAWAGAYVRCRRTEDQSGAQWLEEHVTASANINLRRARALARRVFDRDVPHILLVHPSAFTARSLGTILSSWRAQGVEFVTLEQALADPVYSINPEFVGAGRPFTEQLAASRGPYRAVRDPAYAPTRLAEICPTSLPQP